MANSRPQRPHLLGIDDGPFEKHIAGAETPLVGVMMEGADLVEAVAVSSFPVDGDEVTGFLGQWIDSLRFRPSLQGVLFGGITIAGLGVVDVDRLAKRLGLPVLIVNRRPPLDPPLLAALRSAGFQDRIPIVLRAPAARRAGGLFVSAAGGSVDRVEALLLACIGKSDLPEPLRVAHLMARALVSGESRGKP